ncbi:hypothetical protein GBF38_004743 [Nibea albiflora]|uniref:Uncharacterized protein n=1 Tax=Nibea albiflora TaxID=240163 RepID=A0ACB7FDZ2_NIBAL|nr:hypothetical protein GBF38_004743 [Nibea albiflora]
MCFTSVLSGENPPSALGNVLHAGLFTPDVYAHVHGVSNLKTSAPPSLHKVINGVSDGPRPGLTPSSVNVPAELPGHRGRVIQKTAVPQTDRREDPGLWKNINNQRARDRGEDSDRLGGRELKGRSSVSADTRRSSTRWRIDGGARRSSEMIIPNWNKSNRRR